MPRKNCWAAMVLMILVTFGWEAAQAQKVSGRPQLEKPEYWTTDKGNRIHEELPYLKNGNLETRVLTPLRAKVLHRVFIVGDDHRGDLLRLERVKDYVLVEIRTLADSGHRGRIIVGGPRLSFKGLTLFYGERKQFGAYTLYEEIRAFADPGRDLFPLVVIRFWGPDQGVVYLDPMGSGEPQAIVNFSSAPAKK